MQSSTRREFAGWLAGRVEQVNRDAGWLDTLFTDLSAEVEAELTGRFELRQMQRVSSLANALEKSTEPLVLVEGEPGSGKSVALRHLALVLARAASQIPDAPLPLYVNLRDLDLDPEASSSVDASALCGFIRRHIAGDDANAHAYLERCFDTTSEHKGWTLLLDSFDEIPEILSSKEADGAIAGYARAIASLSSQLRGCRVVVASRPYRGPGRMAWPRFRILPLGEKGRIQFVRSVFKDVETADRVFGELVASGSLTDWLDNPLLLGLFCAHRSATGSLPSSVHAAFESFVMGRLAQYPEVLQMARITPERVRDVLERIAFAMNGDRKVGLTVPQTHVAGLLRDHDVGSRDDHEVRAAMRVAIEIRLARGASFRAQQPAFGFFHRRLQEYFATQRVIRAQGLVGVDALLTDERWRETAVTLLQTGTRETRVRVLERACELLERSVGELARSLPRGRGLNLTDDSSELNSLREQTTPVEFPWSPGALHILGIVAHADRVDDAPEALAKLYRETDSLITAAFVYGLRQDQAWALDVVAATSPARRTTLLAAAFSSSSNLLQEIAFRRAASLSTLPPNVQVGVERTLVWRALTGQLKAEPTRTDAELRRIQGNERYREQVKLLALVPTVDLIASTVSPLVLLSLYCSRVGWSSLLTSLLTTVGIAIYLLAMSWIARFSLRRMLFVSAPQSPTMLQAIYGKFQRVIYLGQERAAQLLLASLMDTSLRAAPLIFLVYAHRRHVVNASVGDFIVASIVSLALSFRPGAYGVVLNSVYCRRWAWPFVGLVSVAAWIVRWPLAVMGFSLYMSLAITALGWVDRASDNWASALNGYLFLGIAGVMGAAWCSDWIKLRRLRKRVSAFDTDELVHELSRLWQNGARGRALRWVREQGRLMPSEQGVHMLSNLLMAIERDIAFAKRGGIFNQRGRYVPERSWSPQFADWYCDYAQGKPRLASWSGATLDELVQIREQARLRIRNVEYKSSVSRERGEAENERDLAI